MVLPGVMLVAAPAAAVAAGKSYTVVIKSLTFGPSPTNLHVGDTIEWINHDIFRHSATATDKSFNVDLVPDARGRILLKKAGTIRFFCRYHPGMAGTLQVQK